MCFSCHSCRSALAHYSNTHTRYLRPGPPVDCPVPCPCPVYAVRPVPPPRRRIDARENGTASVRFAICHVRVRATTTTGLTHSDCRSVFYAVPRGYYPALRRPTLGGSCEQQRRRTEPAGRDRTGSRRKTTIVKRLRHDNSYVFTFLRRFPVQRVQLYPWIRHARPPNLPLPPG